MSSPPALFPTFPLQAWRGSAAHTASAWTATWRSRSRMAARPVCRAAVHACRLNLLGQSKLTTKALSPPFPLAGVARHSCTYCPSPWTALGGGAPQATVHACRSNLRGQCGVDRPPPPFRAPMQALRGSAAPTASTSTASWRLRRSRSRMAARPAAPSAGQPTSGAVLLK